MSPAVLIIDDEDKLRGLLARIIELEGFTVLQASNGKSGLKMVENEDIRVVISDVKLPDANGVELVKQIKEIKPYVEVINLTAYGTIQDGVLAIKNGAFDYITKGDDNDKIIPLLNKALDKANLQYRVLQLEQKVSKKYSFDTILGNSRAIKEAKDLARKVAKTDTTVLFLGETGTGKEVFAQAILYESGRNLKPFVAVNCSAISRELLESELFGYKSGAFTGAQKDKKGLFEEAHGGTIFLDEIGEMSLDLQAKMLRILESGTFIKVGDTKTTEVNVRLMAATNRNLQEEAEAGRFRLDLFYRLSVFTIYLPALKDRKDDIELLAKHFLKEFAEKTNLRTGKMDDRFIQLLKDHTWKGNIRELKNIMERVTILSDGGVITPDLLPYEFHSGQQETTSLDLASVEKHHIYKVLQHTKGNKTETARLLGIGLTTLYRKIEEYNILSF